MSGWFWDRSPAFLRPLRRLKRTLSILLYRWRSVSRAMPPRVVVSEPSGKTERIDHPAISVYAPAGLDPADVRRFLETQTETSVTLAGPGAPETAFAVSPGPELAGLPPTWLESQLLAAVAEDLEWTVAGWAAPVPGSCAPAAEVRGAAPGPGLIRLPRPQACHRPTVMGRAVPHVTDPERLRDLPPTAPIATTRRAGPYFLDEEVGPGRIVRHRTVSLNAALGDLPAVPGTRTVLFLLPFLAVGGAERLLFDLLGGLGQRCRSLVVTLDPHRREFGQTVDTCRALTPWVYTLGDWLPREVQRDALRHLVRRYDVETLVSWNGTVTFYEEAPALRRAFPHLRLVNQLFNHEGGWIEHYGPRLAASVDLHIAVNGPIGRALAEERGVPDERIAVIHHGVDVPPDVAPDARSERRQRARRELGLPPEALVIGSFLRLHAQKRPFDILRLARRLASKRPAGRALHFLLAGGGPLDGEIDRELERRPLDNLTRLPFRSDVEPLFDAVNLCLMTSAYEGLPVFLLEGLARSRPSVATAVGDIPLLLADGGGRVVEVGDLEAFEAAILELCDDERRAAAGQRGRATVTERFGLERFVRNYDKALFPD